MKHNAAPMRRTQYAVIRALRARACGNEVVLVSLVTSEHSAPDAPASTTAEASGQGLLRAVVLMVVPITLLRLPSVPASKAPRRRAPSGG
jgi:hypothetical protein